MPQPSDLERGVDRIDLRRYSPLDSHVPNKLHKPPPKNAGPIGVQSQVVAAPIVQQADPNALPIFPSPERNSPENNNPQNQYNGDYYMPERQSSGSEPGTHRLPERPKLTFALLEEYRRNAKENPNDPAIQLDLGKALLEASVVLSQEHGMNDPKRVAKSRENYISEAYRIVKKLASSVQPTNPLKPHPYSCVGALANFRDRLALVARLIPRQCSS